MSGQRRYSSRDGVELAAVDALTPFGDFFHLQVYPERTPPALPWRPLADLAQNRQFGQRVEQIRSALTAMAGVSPESVHRRVAASVAHLGLSARLVSPTLGTALLTGRPPTIALNDLYWQPEPGGAFPLAVAGPAYERGPTGVAPEALAARFAEWLIDGPVNTITVMARQLGVPDQTLWGNVTSALNGTRGVIARARPDLDLKVAELIAGVLAQAPLAERSRIDSDGRFRRTNCCLIYQVAGDRAAVCGDCVLPARKR